MPTDRKLIETFAQEIAELKAKQQAMHEVNLLLTEYIQELIETFTGVETDRRLFSRKYAEFYEQYQERYSQDILERLNLPGTEVPNT